MSKIAKLKAQEWVASLPVCVIYDDMPKPRIAFEKAYDQAAKDIIARIRVEIVKVIPEEIIFDDDEDYGRKDAFNYVLGVISTLEKEYE